MYTIMLYFCGELVNALACHAGDPSSGPCYHSSVFLDDGLTGVLVTN